MVSHLDANVAVIGRVLLIPGILPVKLESPPVECHISHAFRATMGDPKRGISIDVTDCTIFKVTHLGRGALDLEKVANVHMVFEQSLAAISEVALWVKTKDVVGGPSSFVRQIGTTDVKAFFAQGDGPLVGWVSPAFTFSRKAAGFMAGLLPPMVVSNGPVANPIPPITRRVIGALDLINLGFYTESFVTLFALVDDLTQEVMKSGMTKRGLGEDEQKGFLRAIKEERLKLYLTTLAKLCDWKSLEEFDKGLFDRLMKVNSLRNKIMHGSLRLGRDEALEAGGVLLQAIAWLRGNPFGFAIPPFPLLKPATPEFRIIPLKGEGGEQGPTPPADGSATEQT